MKTVKLGLKSSAAVALLASYQLKHSVEARCGPEWFRVTKCEEKTRPASLSIPVPYFVKDRPGLNMLWDYNLFIVNAARLADKNLDVTAKWLTSNPKKYPAHADFVVRINKNTLLRYWTSVKLLLFAGAKRIAIYFAFFLQYQDASKLLQSLTDEQKLGLLNTGEVDTDEPFEHFKEAAYKLDKLHRVIVLEMMDASIHQTCINQEMHSEWNRVALSLMEVQLIAQQIAGRVNKD